MGTSTHHNFSLRSLMLKCGWLKLLAFSKSEFTSVVTIELFSSYVDVFLLIFTPCRLYVHTKFCACLKLQIEMHVIFSSIFHYSYFPTKLSNNWFEPKNHLAFLVQQLPSCFEFLFHTPFF